MDIFTRTTPDGDDPWAVVRDERYGRFVVAIFFNRAEAKAFMESQRGRALGAFMAEVKLAERVES